MCLWISIHPILCLQIVELEISRSLVSFIQQLVDEDGSVKDSAVCSLHSIKLFSFLFFWTLDCLNALQLAITNILVLSK